MGICFGREATTPPSLTVVPGVTATMLGREWRCKFTKSEAEKAEGAMIGSKSLEAAQKLLDEQLVSLRGIKGVKGLRRIVCGTCSDFKVIVTAGVDDFKAWETQAKFAPEADFLEKLKQIEGVSAVETQTYTFEQILVGFQSTDDEPLTLVPGVTATVLGREWRCKFTASETEKAEGALIGSKSLEAAQKLMVEQESEIIIELGLEACMERTVCGACSDFKVTLSAPEKRFKKWEGAKHTPEADFVEKLGKIDGISAVEVQTYTVKDLSA